MMDELVIEEMSIRAVQEKMDEAFRCCDANSINAGEEHAATVVSKKPGTRNRGLYRSDSRSDQRSFTIRNRRSGRRVPPLLLGLPLQLWAGSRGSRSGEIVACRCSGELLRTRGTMRAALFRWISGAAQAVEKPAAGQALKPRLRARRRSGSIARRPDADACDADRAGQSWQPRSGVDEPSGDGGFRALTAPALWQHGFEPRRHPFKVTAQRR